MTNGWSGSGGAAISLLRALGVLRSVVRGRPTATLWLAGLWAGLPSSWIGLTGAAILRGTGRTAVVGITLGRGLPIWARRHHARYRLVGRVTGTRWNHAWLTIAHHTSSTRGREVASRGIIHRAVHVATRNASGSGLLHANLVALSDLTLQLLPTDLTTLGQRDIERFGANHLVVHLCDGLGSFLGTGVANESEALGVVFLIAHDFGASDGSERLELRAELFVVNVVIEILDVEVDALILAQLLHLSLLV